VAADRSRARGADRVRVADLARDLARRVRRERDGRADRGFAGIATGNTLEAVAGAWLLGRIGFRPALERIRHVLGLITAGAIASTTISATIGLVSLCLGGVQPWSAFARIWVVWWLGDAMSVLVVAPLLLAWSSWPPRAWTRARVGESLALLAGVSAALLLIFGMRVPEANPLHYSCFPFVIVAALRFGSPARPCSARSPH
jgi:integral membrane sensor domain MASE1